MKQVIFGIWDLTYQSNNVNSAAIGSLKNKYDKIFRLHNQRFGKLSK